MFGKKSFQSLQNSAYAPYQAAEDTPAQFEEFRAARLYCPDCRMSVEVRERLLLVVPDGELYDYTCVHCGALLGDRKVQK